MQQNVTKIKYPFGIDAVIVFTNGARLEVIVFSIYAKQSTSLLYWQSGQIVKYKTGGE